MERCSTQAVLPLVGLAAKKLIRDRYKGNPWRTHRRHAITMRSAFCKQTVLPPINPPRAPSNCLLVKGNLKGLVVASWRISASEPARGTRESPEPPWKLDSGARLFQLCLEQG
ncbi:MAG: hypothetical protein ACQESR_18945 [Planctomycetota bacterium]